MTIAPVNEAEPIPSEAKCQEASIYSRDTYIPCGEVAVAIVRHENDRRSYYMCAACADHNVKNRGGRLIHQDKKMQPAIEQNNDLEKRVLTSAEIAQRFEIQSQQIADQAAAHLTGIMALRKEAKDHHDPMIKAGHQAHVTALAAFNKIDKPLELAERILRLKLTEYAQQVERARIEAQRRLEAEARRQQEEEAERLIEEAESQGATPVEAQAIIEQTAMAPAPIVPALPRAPVVSGFTTRDQWAAELGVNVAGQQLSEAQAIKVLCKAIAENGNGSATVTCLSINWTVLNQLARAQKETFNVPGFRAVNRGGLAKKSGGR